MALIANVSFSKKVPVDGQDYSSQGYSLSLQTEIAESDPAAIQARLHATFELVKHQVESELANRSGKQTGLVHPGANTTPQPLARTGNKASAKQVAYLTKLATQLHGMSLSDLHTEIQQRFGVSGLYDLDRKQASSLIDELAQQRKAA